MSARIASAKWVRRCSNPRLLVFSQVLHRLSYRPKQKKPGVFRDTGLLQKSRYFEAECHKRQWRTGRVFAG